LLEETPLVINLEDDWREIAYTKAKYIPHDLIKDTDEKSLFMPKTTHVPLREKLGENVERPRYLEQEGYYVGRKPYVTTKNRNLMENRLIKLANGVNKLREKDNHRFFL
jgi:coiled-coil and C2 domain-containing protein 2A